MNNKKLSPSIPVTKIAICREFTALLSFFRSGICWMVEKCAVFFRKW